jgi:uncharacterized membrane protein
MEIFQIPTELQDFINRYDKKSYQLWNDEKNKDVNNFRRLIRITMFLIRNLLVFTVNNIFFYKWFTLASRTYFT